MRINEVTETDVDKMVYLFGELLKICQEELDFDTLPKIQWVSDGSYGKKYHSFGSFQPDAGIVTVSITGRHIIDMMRTLAHELVHYKQMLDGRLGPGAGKTGSPIENEANAMAGVIMRKFDHKFPEAFSIKPILNEHVIEIGRIYGTKDIPIVKDKIHSADKGKVHHGLRISEVVGQRTPEVYVDMDGVLADFFKVWNEMVGVGHWKEIQDPKKALEMIHEHPTFWLDLPPLSNAPRLLGAIKKFAGSYYICTSPLGGDPKCEPQKREWVHKHLANFPPKEVYVTHDKPQFAVQADGTPNILIDDFGTNIKAWRAAGGIAIHYENKNVDRAIMELKSAMNPDHPQTNGDQSTQPSKKALSKEPQ
jgi:5' nucleotidase, deoxy (Pyrimidine), cytosolic type C protein (NT5C)